MAQASLTVARLILAALLLAGAAATAKAERRVALVIGNAAYATKPLANAANDATAVAATLKDKLGFDSVELKLDQSRQQLVDALRAFETQAAGADVALIYFSGHGTALEQIDTYLVPIDAKLARESDLEDEAVSLKSVLRRLEAVQGLRLVILDACRNPPFALAGRKRAESRGLGRIEPEDNTLIAYATKDGTTADDGAGPHSPFTTALLKHIETPGIDVTFVFRAVRDEVMAATGRIQQPHLYGTLGGKPIYLKSGAPGEQAQTALLMSPAPAAPTPEPTLAPVQLRLQARISKQPGVDGPSRPWLGVKFREFLPNAPLRKALAIPGANGAYVLEVVSGGPAEAAGIRPGDILIRADGQEIVNKGSLPNIVGQTPLDSLITFELWRVGRGPEDLLAALQKRVERNDPLAAHVTASLYADEIGVKRDDAQIARLSRIAADSNVPEAMLTMGDLYLAGQGVPKDAAEAVRWYRRSADGGNAEAMYKLGFHYEDGVGVGKDDAEALRWYRKAADNGYADSMNAMGRAYEEKRGVPKDETEAVRWYRKGADAGSYAAMENLAHKLFRGQGTAKDEAEAARLYRKAVDVGSGTAMYNLAALYHDGKGVPNEPETAAEFAFMAIEVGEPFAIKQMTENAADWSAPFRKALQQKLKDSGLYSGPIDGKFGPSVKTAILALAAKAKR